MSGMVFGIALHKYGRGIDFEFWGNEGIVKIYFTYGINGFGTCLENT